MGTEAGGTRPAGPSWRALLVDWGGVLTVPLDGAMGDWAARDGVDLDHLRGTLRDWAELALAERGAGPAAPPVHALERGEIGPAEFETILADELTRRGSPVRAAGLLGRMLAGLQEPDPDVHALVRRVRSAGVLTALVSNSWGHTYDRTGWDELFDAVVISGEVGMRKPEARIFEHAAGLLGVTPAECVLVDDLPWNCDGARAVGMAAVHHVDAATTAAQLEDLLGVELGPPG